MSPAFGGLGSVNVTEAKVRLTLVGFVPPTRAPQLPSPIQHRVELFDARHVVSSDCASWERQQRGVQHDGQVLNVQTAAVARLPPVLSLPIVVNTSD